MNLWEFLEKSAAVAEEIDERVEKARDAQHMAEVVIGRGILTERFIGRGHAAIGRLTERAERGKPPGLLATGEEIFEFLLPEQD